MNFPADTITTRGTVTACDNLRRPHPCHPLVPAPRPCRLTDGGWELLHYRYIDRDETLLLRRGRELMIYDDASGRAFTVALPAEPLSAVDTASGFLVMTAAGAVLLSFSERRWCYTPAAEVRSPLTLTAADCGTISAVTGTLRFGGAYTYGTTTLHDADASLITRSLAAAYRDLAATASRRGRRLQPVLGYYRLVDGDGREIYRSSPVVLGSSAGLAAMEPVRAALSRVDAAGGFAGVGMMRIDATPYAVMLRRNTGGTVDPAANALLQAAAAVEVYLSPQLHPVDFSAAAEYRIEPAADNLSYLSAYIPGTSAGMEPLRNSQARVVESLLARLDDAVEAAGRIALDGTVLRAPSDMVEVPCITPATPQQELASLRRIMARKPAARPSGPEARLLELCSPPHSFTASVATSAGNAVLWGNPQPHLFAGHAVEELARDAAAGTALSVATVTVRSPAGTQRVSAPSGGEGVVATGLAPLICYPLPEASSLSVVTRDLAGVARARDFPLRSVPGCRYAFWLNPSLRPLDIADWDAAERVEPPADVRLDESTEGAVLTAAVTDPLRPLGARMVAQAPLTALMPGIMTRTGWDFSYSRFHVMAADGIYSLSLGESLRPGKPVALSRCGVFARPSLSPQGTLAVAGGKLVRISGGKLTQLLSDVTAAAYEPATDEIWVVVAGGLRCYDADMSGYYTRSDLRITSLASTPSRLLLSTVTGDLLDASHPAPLPEATPVFYSRRLQLAPGCRVVGIEAVMQGADLSGRLLLGGDGGVGGTATATIASLDIAGGVSSPIAARVLSPRRRYVTVTLQMLVDPSFSLTAINLLTTS